MEYIYGATVVALALTAGLATHLWIEWKKAMLLARYYKSKYDLVVNADEIYQLLEETCCHDGE